MYYVHVSSSACSEPSQSQHALRVHGATEEPVTSVRQVAHLLFTGDCEYAGLSATRTHTHARTHAHAHTHHTHVHTVRTHMQNIYIAYDMCMPVLVHAHIQPIVASGRPR